MASRMISSFAARRRMCAGAQRNAIGTSACRALSTTPACRNEEASPRPRWSYTPEGMKAPFSPHVTKNPNRSHWVVNEDPDLLDGMYTRLLGRDGSRLLTDELKWLAVTHKSFDQARRGMNDRLAYIGRMAIMHECAKMIATSAPKETVSEPDEYGRKPFDDALLASLDNLSLQQPKDIVSIENIERVALDVGLLKVLRWKPRMPDDLSASGQHVVLNSAIQAIFGAILLQHGSEVASTLIRERLIARIKSSS
ncbi:hypothetical protein BROUX41_005656 [Berkeleyomyces rouxiae]|uniref:uncharacterized protein n=1 Tax=Berkeleyomyces rouxiae TaxID=2035830 RepID=UPI003B7C5D83